MSKSLKKLNTSGVTGITGMSIMKDVLANTSERGGIRLKGEEGSEKGIQKWINQNKKEMITPGQMFKNMRNKKKTNKNGEKVIKIRIKSRSGS